MMVNFLVFVAWPCITIALREGDTGVCKISDSMVECCQGYRLNNNSTCEDCPNGTFGKDCLQKCKANFYGFRCHFQCYCDADEMCDYRYGCIILTKNDSNNTGGNITKEDAETENNVLPTYAYYIIIGNLFVGTAVVSIIIFFKYKQSRKQTVVSERPVDMSCFTPKDINVHNLNAVGKIKSVGEKSRSSYLLSQKSATIQGLDLNRYGNEVTNKYISGNQDQRDEPNEITQMKLEMSTSRDSPIISNYNFSRSVKDIYTEINPFTKANISEKSDWNSSPTLLPYKSTVSFCSEEKYTEIYEIPGDNYLTPTDLNVTWESSVSLENEAPVYSESMSFDEPIYDEATSLNEIECHTECSYLTPIALNDSPDIHHMSLDTFKDNEDEMYAEIHDYMNY